MQFGNRTLDLSHPRVMGILNVTPDSFSDGGRFHLLDAALNQAGDMVEQGADFVDIGGESTRPGAEPVGEQEELDRVIPVIEAVAQRLDTCISIDTSKAIVMREAVRAGATLINDVRALREPGCLETAAEAGVPICLMHMQGEPRSMQANPQYGDVVSDILTFFKQRIAACQQAGIRPDQILLDPGFGFGKTLEQNYQLLASLSEFSALDQPLLVGMSRKSMLGKLLNREVDQRLAGGIAATTVALLGGANIIRVHDVAETVDAVKVLSALNPNKEKQ